MRRSPLKIVLIAALWPGLWSGMAAAQSNDLRRFLEICADPNQPAREHRNFCRRALDDGGLDATQSAQVWVNYGVAAADMGDLNDALMAYTRAIVADPALIQAYLNRASVNLARGQLGQASADYDAVLIRDGGNVEAMAGRGVVLLSQGRVEDAVAAFNQALGRNSGWVPALFNRGIAYRELGRFPESEADFSAVLRRAPEDAEAYVQRARTRAAGRLPGAAEDFGRAIELAPEWAAAWFARGRYLDDTGDSEAANADFRRAYELGYQDPWLVERIRTISG